MKPSPMISEHNLRLFRCVVLVYILCIFGIILNIIHYYTPWKLSTLSTFIDIKKYNWYLSLKKRHKKYTHKLALQYEDHQAQDILFIQAKTMLSNEQQSRLLHILNGSITKKHIEIVLSKYDEDISWIRMYAPLVTIYDKSKNIYEQISLGSYNTMHQVIDYVSNDTRYSIGNTDRSRLYNYSKYNQEDTTLFMNAIDEIYNKTTIMDSKTTTITATGAIHNHSNQYSNIKRNKVRGKKDVYKSSPHIIAMKNTGRECYTYLYHIIQNYYQLADVTIFSHASPPTRGYKGHRSGGGHLLGNSTFHDYVLNPYGHFIFTSALSIPTGAHIVRYGYNKGYLSRQHALKKCMSMHDTLDNAISLTSTISRHETISCSSNREIGSHDVSSNISHLSDIEKMTRLHVNHTDDDYEVDKQHYINHIYDDNHHINHNDESLILSKSRLLLAENIPRKTNGDTTNNGHMNTHNHTTDKEYLDYSRTDLEQFRKGYEKDGRFTIEFLIQHIGNLCKKEKQKVCDIGSFWDTYIKLPRPPGNIIYFAQGAIFSVTSAQIRRRSITDYQALLNTCIQYKDPSSGYFMEWFWYYLLTSEVSPCPVHGYEFDWLPSILSNDSSIDMDFRDRMKNIHI